MLTSEHLTIGQTYTRVQLKEQFGIVDKTIDTGIFRPKGYDSIWLFVTEKKTSDRTQYVDLLDGDILMSEGQKQGRTNHYVINHCEDNKEILLFYRERVSQYPGAGFKYEGEFNYYSHEGQKPAHFTLYRARTLETIVDQDISADEYQQEYFEGEAKQRYTNYYERDPKVRLASIKAHGTACMACGFDFEKRYGVRGLGYIEVHHTKPVSSLKEKTSINPATDTIVVCPNCHRMIHRSAAHVLTLEELKAILQ